jgi:hypothetical protein
MCRALSHLDVKNLDDHSVVDLGLVKGAERVRRLLQTATASSDMKPYGPTNDTSDCAEFSLNRLGVAMTRTATTMSAIVLNRFGPLADA